MNDKTDTKGGKDMFYIVCEEVQGAHTNRKCELYVL